MCKRHSRMVFGVRSRPQSSCTSKGLSPDRLMAPSATYTPRPRRFVLPFDLSEVACAVAWFVWTRCPAVRSAASLPEAGQRICRSLGPCCALGSALTFEGLKRAAEGDGPLNLLVTDYFAGSGAQAEVCAAMHASTTRHFTDAGSPTILPSSSARGAGDHHRTQEGAQTYQGLVAALARWVSRRRPKRIFRKRAIADRIASCRRLHYAP